MKLQKIISLAKARSYFSIITSSGKRANKYEFGPSGTLLLENIKKEWINSTTMHKEINVFFHNNVISHQKQLDLTDVLKDNDGRIPLGIAEILLENDTQESVDEYDGYFRPEKSTMFRCSMVLPPADAMQFFLHWQRQRKIWWSKITTSPGLFALGDIKATNNICTTVNIVAQFPWGGQKCEAISLESMEGYKVKHGRKLVTPVKVSSSLHMETATLCLFCDATIDNVEESGHIKLHRKMAPYKCSFAIVFDDAAKRDDLSGLATLINRRLRLKGIITLAPDFSDACSLESQFQKSAEVGIPYTVILNEDTLKTGIANLMNRDTTLEEQVHISDLCEYMKNILKNF